MQLLYYGVSYTKMKKTVKNCFKEVIHLGAIQVNVLCKQHILQPKTVLNLDKNCQERFLILKLFFIAQPKHKQIALHYRNYLNDLQKSSQTIRMEEPILL